MKIKNRMTLVLFCVLMILLAAEVFLGEFYFEKYFRYNKLKELENINFIFNGKINYEGLKVYQKDTKGFVLIIKDEEIFTLNNFSYLVLKDNEDGEEKIFLLDEFLDNLYSYGKFEAESGEKLVIEAVKLLGNYYIPITIDKDRESYVDYKNINKNMNIENIKGSVKKFEISSRNYSQADDFLEFLISKKIEEITTDDYFDYDLDDEFRIINREIDGYTVMVFYSYEDLKDIFPTIRSYFYFKGLLMIVIVIVVGKVFGKNIVDPIEKLSLMAKNIGKLNFQKMNYKKSNDEIEELYREIYRMSDNLENVINLYKTELTENRNRKKETEERVRYFTHEIKTPLSAIIGFTELLYEEDNREEIKIINTEGKRLLKLTNELLAKEEIEEETGNFSLFNLSQTVQMVLKIYEKELEKFEVWADFEDNIEVLGNKEKIEQVLFNLLTNSIQHADKVIKISITEGLEEVFVTVENDGEKIPEENFSKIWNKYFSTRKTGTGLGLYLCREIFEMHNSNYRIANLGIGVQVKFSLKKGMK